MHSKINVVSVLYKEFILKAPKNLLGNKHETKGINRLIKKISILQYSKIKSIKLRIL